MVNRGPRKALEQDRWHDTMDGLYSFRLRPSIWCLNFTRSAHRAHIHLNGDLPRKNTIEIMCVLSKRNGNFIVMDTVHVCILIYWHMKSITPHCDLVLNNAHTPPSPHYLPPTHTTCRAQEVPLCYLLPVWTNPGHCCSEDIQNARSSICCI